MADIAVTIYPLTDPKYPYAFNPMEAMHVTIQDGQRFIAGLRGLFLTNKITLEPGQYVMIEDAFGVITKRTQRGILFTVNANGTLTEGHVGSVPRLTTWPPKA